MRLLIVTQVVDTNDRYLGFFHAWITEFAKHAERVTVICLKEGAHSLPENVAVHSLGKEKGGASRLVYAARFIKLMWELRHGYDAVFVHMNQEYLLLGGMIWRFLGKRTALWRNHYAGSILTVIAASLATTVFYTSRRSFTARFKKAVRMPVGVETSLFGDISEARRDENTILSFGRLAPSKRIELLIEAVDNFADEDVKPRVTICGSALPEDVPYEKSLMDRSAALRERGIVAFLPGVSHAQAPGLFAAHSIYVNCAPPGMLDKTIFEAAASGCLLVTSSTDARDIFGEDTFVADASELRGALKRLLTLSPDEASQWREKLKNRAREHALSALIPKVLAEMQVSVANP